MSARPPPPVFWPRSGGDEGVRGPSGTGANHTGWYGGPTSCPKLLYKLVGSKLSTAISLYRLGLPDAQTERHSASKADKGIRVRLKRASTALRAHHKRRTTALPTFSHSFHLRCLTTLRCPFAACHSFNVYGASAPASLPLVRPPNTSLAPR